AFNSQTGKRAMAEPPMPDLSHLSAEERQIIEEVFQRQREEEEKETQLSQ
ncbi:hypothetical protein X798_07562, partial [Onchocerca flexuosa]